MNKLVKIHLYCESDKEVINEINRNLARYITTEDENCINEFNQHIKDIKNDEILAEEFQKYDLDKLFKKEDQSDFKIEEFDPKSSTQLCMILSMQNQILESIGYNPDMHVVKKYQIFKMKFDLDDINLQFNQIIDQYNQGNIDSQVNKNFIRLKCMSQIMIIIDQDMNFMLEVHDIKKKEDTSQKAENIQQKLMTNMRKKYMGQKMTNTFTTAIKSKFNMKNGDSDPKNKEKSELTEEEKTQKQEAYKAKVAQLVENMQKQKTIREAKEAEDNLKNPEKLQDNPGPAPAETERSLIENNNLGTQVTLGDEQPENAKSQNAMTKFTSLFKSKFL